MSVIVQIPPPLRSLTGGLERAQATGGTVAEVVSTLNAAFPGIADRLYPEGNELNRFVAIFVNGQDIRLLEGDQTTLRDGDLLVILPLVAGGSLYLSRVA